MTTTTSESFINYLIALQIRPLNHRSDQHMLNTLCDYNPKLAEEVRGQSDTIDPFYSDKKIPVFLEYIIQNWNKYDKVI